MTHNLNHHLMSECTDPRQDLLRSPTRFRNSESTNRLRRHLRLSYHGSPRLHRRRASLPLQRPHDRLWSQLHLPKDDQENCRRDVVQQVKHPPLARLWRPFLPILLQTGSKNGSVRGIRSKQDLLPRHHTGNRGIRSSSGCSSCSRNWRTCTSWKWMAMGRTWRKGRSRCVSQQRTMEGVL